MNDLHDYQPTIRTINALVGMALAPDGMTNGRTCINKQRLITYLSLLTPEERRRSNLITNEHVDIINHADEKCDDMKYMVTDQVLVQFWQLFCRYGNITRLSICIGIYDRSLIDNMNSVLNTYMI
jgi:hypothetical protein